MSAIPVTATRASDDCAETQAGGAGGLAERDTSFETIFRESPDAMVIVRVADGTIVAANAALLALVEVDAGSVSGLLPADLLEFSALPSGGAGPKSGNLEVRFQTRQGRERVAHASYQTIIYGGATCRLTTLRDFTDDRAKAAALRSERDFASTVLTTAASLVLVHDRAGRIVQFNRALETMTGWSLAEVKGLRFFDVLAPPERREEIRERTRDATPAEYPQKAESEWITRGGERRRVEWTRTALTNADRAIEYFVTTATDVTDRRRDEEVVRQNSALRRAILDSANLSIISTDAEGRIRTFNATAEKWLGWKASEVIGQWAPGPVHDRTEVARRAAELTRELGRPIEPGPEVLGAKARLGQPDENEWTYIRKDGSRFPVSLTVTPLYDSRGVLEGFLGTAADITDRKEIDRIKNEFISTVSHELRTPLTSIRGALGLLEGGVVGTLPEEAREWLEMARVNSDRLARLINDILDLQKMEAGHLELHLERIEVGELLRAAVEGVRGMAEQTHVHLRAVAHAPIHLSGDRDRLLQVITNFLSNAIKYSSEGGLVEVRSERTRDGRLRIDVSDHGPGIPAHKLGKLFGKFQQLDSSDARAKQGTGLGLAISKAIVEQHHGDVGVESTVGQGTTFFCLLPAEAEVRSTVLPPRAGRLSALVVEDDAGVARTLEQLLVSTGYSVDAAPTLADARRLLAERTPDVVLLDIHLPDGNGLDLLASLCGDQPTKDIPVIILSGEAPEGAGAGMPLVFDWITKPFDEQRLADALRRVVGQLRQKVLIVDDDPHARSVVAAQLRALHLQCFEAADGKGALAMNEEIHPDLIILDLALPGLDGYEVVEHLRRHSSHPVPLLVYTSSDLSEEERSSLRFGLTRHLTKTRATDGEFLRGVKELLETASLARNLITEGVTPVPGEVPW